MMLTTLLAITSFFSFGPNIRLLEEKWFPTVEKKFETELIVTYSAPLQEDPQALWTKILFQKMLQDELQTSTYLHLNSAPSQSSLSFSCEPSDYSIAKIELQASLDKIKSQGFSPSLLSHNIQEIKVVLGQEESADQLALNELQQKVDFSPIINTLSIKEELAASSFDLLTHMTMEAPKEFLDLPLNETEKQLIYKIINTMATKSVIMLGFEKRSLEKKGKRVNHVHPFRFLGYVYSEPRLKAGMVKIEESHFKWNGFIDGYSKKMRNEASQNNLLPYVQSFAHYLNVDKDIVTFLVQKGDYEGLVRFLFIDTKDPR